MLYKMSRVKMGCMLVCRSCDRSSKSLNKTSVTLNSRGVYLRIGRLSELFDDISLVLNVTRLYTLYIRCI